MGRDKATPLFSFFSSLALIFSPLGATMAGTSFSLAHCPASPQEDWQSCLPGDSTWSRSLGPYVNKSGPKRAVQLKKTENLAGGHNLGGLNESLVSYSR
jgi:hypothetical protein